MCVFLTVILHHSDLNECKRAFGGGIMRSLIPGSAPQYAVSSFDDTHTHTHTHTHMLGLHVQTHTHTNMMSRRLYAHITIRMHSYKRWTER